MVIYRKITELEKLEWNPRTIKKEDMDRLIQSIKSFWVIEWRPFLLSNRTGKLVIIWWNQRYEACKKLWIKEVPTHLIEWLTEEQEKEIIIRDNVSNGEWDMDLLANEWDTQSLIDWGVDINFETVEPTAEEDDFEVDEGIKTDIVLWDLFEIGEHRLLCWDSTNIDDVNKLMNGEKADMVFTDPPYGYRYESNHQDKFDELLNDDVILDFIPNVLVSSKDNIWIFIFCWWQTISEWIWKVKESWLSLKNIIIWKKNNWSMWDLKWAYWWQYEVILFCHKWRVELKNGRWQDIWEFDRQPPTIHPTMKPIELVSKAVQDVSEKNDIVLDLFWWSGSTMVACHQLNRKCYMSELDPKYVQTIVNRMTKLAPELEIKRNWQIYNTTQ